MKHNTDAQAALGWLDKKEAILLGCKENKKFQTPFRQRVCNNELKCIETIREALGDDNEE